MNKLLSKCPVCEHELLVTGLECSHCGTEIHGHFALGRFARLGTDDLYFIEIFVKNRGNAYRVAEELEIPYSGVRARLTDIIGGLGYATETERPEIASLPPERRKEVLEELSKGKITSEEAIKILQGETA
jgi:hypothetical protein